MDNSESNSNAVNKVNDLIQKKFFGLARETLIKALAKFPNDISLRIKLVEIYYELRDSHKAHELITDLLEEIPDNDQLFSLYPHILLGTGRVEEAIEAAIQLRERIGLKNPNAIGQLVEIYENTSREDDLKELIEGFTPKDDLGEFVKLNGQARIATRDKEYDTAIRFLTEAKSSVDKITQPKMFTNKMVDCCFQMAKVYDRMGEYDKSWEQAEEAHKFHQQYAPRFDTEKYTQTLEDTARRMDMSTLKSLARSDEQLAWQPLYIVGNPRSGTSLLEQVLSMHPEVANGGEMTIGLRIQEDLFSITDSFHSWPNTILDMRVEDANQLAQTYMAALKNFSDGKSVVSNKALNLQLQLGLLSLVTPNAKAIMLYRYPLDNCVSCYTTNLLASGHLYCSNLEDMGKVWMARRKIMEHWQDHLDIPVLELHYEHLVQNQEFETRRILDFLNLSWDESCLEFHKSNLVARTISYDQVNRKMYTSSSGRWKNYEKHLSPFIDLVSDYL